MCAAQWRTACSALWRSVAERAVLEVLQLLEKLYRLRWGRYDGLGALIISPTRELAAQIFDELRRVGARHDLSAGLLIGGKGVREEQERVNGAPIRQHRRGGGFLCLIEQGWSGSAGVS